jgi:glyoxylase-like metal-dependent hydrolase (beta-lactamase superfamily II)
MADDIRLYMFQCGTLNCHVENIKMNQGLGEEYEIPVPWFLVTHPRGNVVIDGGSAAECATDPVGHWGAISKVYYPRMTANQACVPALREAGFDPADVAFILQSHLHLDHTGAVAALDEFPNAEVVATRTNTGSVLLTVDAAYTTDHWEEKALPGFLASAVETVRSVRKLHRIAASSASTVVTGHDPDAWPGFKQAPEFYD